VNLLGLTPIPIPEPVEESIRQLRVNKADLPPVTPPATPEDGLARKAAAIIEQEDGYYGCAEHRLNGAYDGDTEHRIALKAIELFKQSLREAGAAEKAARQQSR
jgi:hypothetical protein